MAKSLSETMNGWLADHRAKTTYFKKVKTNRLVVKKVPKNFVAVGGEEDKTPDPRAARVTAAKAAKLAAEAKDSKGPAAGGGAKKNKSWKSIYNLQIKCLDQASDELLVATCFAKLGFCSLQHGNVAGGPDFKNAKTKDYKEATATVTITSEPFDPQDTTAKQQNKTFMEFAEWWRAVEAEALKQMIEQDMVEVAATKRAELEVKIKEEIKKELDGRLKYKNKTDEILADIKQLQEQYENVKVSTAQVIEALRASEHVTDRFRGLPGDEKRNLVMSFEWPLFLKRGPEDVYQAYYNYASDQAKAEMWKRGLTEEQGIREGLLVEDNVILAAWNDGWVYNPVPIVQAPVLPGQKPGRVPYFRLQHLSGGLASVVIRVTPLCNSGPKGNEKYSGIKHQLEQVMFGRERESGPQVRRKPVPLPDLCDDVPPLSFGTDDRSRFSIDHEQSLDEAARQMDEIEQRQAKAKTNPPTFLHPQGAVPEASDAALPGFPPSASPTTPPLTQPDKSPSKKRKAAETNPIDPSGGASSSSGPNKRAKTRS